jgi:hypothetical protein
MLHLAITPESLAQQPRHDNLLESERQEQTARKAAAF